jgi:hypothetical protein
MMVADAPLVSVLVDQGRIASAVRRPELRLQMIAESVGAVLPNATAVKVDIGSIRLTLRATRYVYAMPAACQRALAALERGERPRPFSFLLANGQAVPRRRNTTKVERNRLTLASRQ